MAYNEFLRNITSWQTADLKTIDFYYRMLMSCFSQTISGVRMPASVPSLYSSWFLGKDNGAYTSGVVLEPAPPSAVQKKYPNWNGASGAIGFGLGGVFNNDRYLITDFYDMTDGRLCAYLEVVPMSQYLTDYRLNNFRFVRCMPFAGAACEKFQLPTSVAAKYFCASGWYPEIEDNDYTQPNHNYVYDDTILNLVTVKKIEYYFVKNDGTRTQLREYSPCFPFVVDGKYVSEQIINNNVYSEKRGFDFINCACQGVGEISLPSGYKHPTSSATNIYAFTINASNGSNGTNYRNDGKVFFCSSRDQLLSYLGQIINISEGGVFLNSNSTPANQICFDFSKCPSIYCPFNLQYVAAVADGAKLRTNQIFTNGVKHYGGGNSMPIYMVAAGGSFQTFKEIFEDWGIYCTDNLDEILYGEIPDIPHVSPSGGNSGFDPSLPPNGNNGEDIPSNIPSNSDNRIDDFIVNTPNITPVILCNSYVYTTSSVRDLFTWFCSKSYIDNQSELFADKLSAIYGLILYPFDFLTHDPRHLTYTDTTTIVSVTNNVVGYILLPNYNTIIKGGEITYLSYYGNYADWTLCKYSIYIPYAGVVELSPSVVVNRRLTLEYSIDLLTGKATAIIKSYAMGNNDLGVLVKLIPCQVGQLVPIQSSNYAQREISNTLSAVSMLGTLTNVAAGVATEDVGGVVKSLFDIGYQLTDYTLHQQLNYCATGSLSPSTGLGLSQTPYLSIARSYLATPENYRTQNGIPTAYYARLNSVSTGSNFVVCENIYLDTVRATSEEIEEIRSLLSSGVYI